MRAALLLIPIAALAAPLAFAAQDDSAMDDLNAAYAADEEMDLGMDMNMSTDMNMGPMDMNVTAEEAARPAWLSVTTGMWLWAGEEAGGSVWYFDAFDSDFSTSLYRVALRTDETPDPARTHDNTARTAEIVCASRRYRILATIHYDAAGRASEANERGDGSLVPIAPGSVFAQVADTVCSHATGQRTVFTNGM